MDEELSKHIKVAEDDPLRCQGVTKWGQCNYRAYVDEETGNYDSYCIKHGGGIKKYHKDMYDTRNYRFQKYQQRINSFADNNQIKSLREEIGIIRMVMEEVINRCKDGTDILMYSQKISDLTMKIEKLVVSCHRLESNLGQTLDKTAMLNIATRMVNIISEHVNDETIINLIVEDIGALIKE